MVLSPTLSRALKSAGQRPTTVSLSSPVAPPLQNAYLLAVSMTPAAGVHETVDDPEALRLVGGRAEAQGTEGDGALMCRQRRRRLGEECP
ncbi:hypothetical protein ACWD25_48135 [Streptomyces sp. NPDC002920]